MLDRAQSHEEYGVIYAWYSRRMEARLAFVKRARKRLNTKREENDCEFPF